MAQYLPLLGLFVLAGGFAAISFGMSKLLAPSRVTEAKEAPYECGIMPSRESPERFPVKFFLVAMIFVVLDIEIIFLYPWAMTFRDLGLVGLFEMAIFSVAVLVSFVYLIANGALEWGQSAVRNRVSAMVSAQRTTTSTVRRVGHDGRESRSGTSQSSDEAA